MAMLAAIFSGLYHLEYDAASFRRAAAAVRYDAKPPWRTNCYEFRAIRLSALVNDAAFH